MPGRFNRVQLFPQPHEHHSLLISELALYINTWYSLKACCLQEPPASSTRHHHMFAFHIYSDHIWYCPRSGEHTHFWNTQKSAYPLVDQKNKPWEVQSAARGWQWQRRWGRAQWRERYQSTVWKGRAWSRWAQQRWPFRQAQRCNWCSLPECILKISQISAGLLLVTERCNSSC